MTDRTDAIAAHLATIPAESRAAYADWQVADYLNAQTITALGDVPLLKLRNILGPKMELAKIEEGIASPDLATRLLCRTVQWLLQDETEAKFLGWGDATNIPDDVEALLTSLVAGSFISQASMDAVIATQMVVTPKWDPPFDAREIGLARGGT